MIRALLALVIAAGLAGCGANYVVHGSTGATSAAGAASALAGTTSVVINGGLTASIALGAGAANVIAGIGVASLLLAGNNISAIPPPSMLEGRKVNEQDCTAPIVDFTANLKCR